MRTRIVLSLVLSLVAVPGAVFGQASVREFGAVGDGVADDSAAFARAIASLDGLGGALRVPKGTYNLGTRGIRIPKTFGGIRLVGDSATASRLMYRGNEAAVQFGEADGWTYGHALSDLQIDLSGAGPDAVGVRIHAGLYFALIRLYLTSNHTYGPAVNRQVGIEAIGGDSQNKRFGAHLRVEDPRIVGRFKKGIYFTASEIGWGFNACILEGGAIVYPGGVPEAGTVGIHIEQGNQNVITLVDVEHYAVGIRSDAYSNLFMGSRTEANELGLMLSAATDGLTGGAYNKVVSGFHSDGVKNLSVGSQMVATSYPVETAEAAQTVVRTAGALE